MTAPPRGRLILWYCLAIGSLGAFHPLLSLVLLRRGATEAEIPFLLALFPLGLLFAAPFWGRFADRTGNIVRVVSFAMSAAALGAFGTLFARDVALLVPALALIAASRGGAIALFDVHTIATLGGGEEGRAAYGRVRMWGSMMFVLAVQLVGVLAVRWPDAPLWVNAALMGSLAILTWALPPTPGARAPSEPVRLRSLLEHPVLMRFFVISVLHVAAMSAYDHLFALHGAAQGLSDAAIGAAFALGVGAEVGVLFLSPALLSRFKPSTLLVVAVLAGIPRWWITGVTDNHAALVLVQATHGLTFGLWWVGGIAYASEAAPKHLQASAQAGFVASGFGLGSLAALLIASQALPAFGGPVLFQGLAVVSVLASVLLPWALRHPSGSTPA
ncbi:MAG: MFS transporter [Deltaproteobacteria bacterium]|nr:MFS transporter [Deltaproteobacteria bacterium]